MITYGRNNPHKYSDPSGYRSVAGVIGGDAASVKKAAAAAKKAAAEAAKRKAAAAKKTVKTVGYGLNFAVNAMNTAIKQASKVPVSTSSGAAKVAAKMLSNKVSYVNESGKPETKTKDQIKKEAAKRADKINKALNIAMANKPAAKSLIPMFSQVLSKTAMKFTDKETVGSLANKLKGLCDNPSSATSRPNRIDRGEPLENVSHKTNVLGEFFGGIGNFIGDVGDAIVDFGHEVLTVIDDSLEEMSKASAEIAAFFASISLVSGTVAVNTVVIPTVSGPAAVIAFVSGGIALIFAGGTVITGTALTVTGVLGTKLNGEKLTAEEAAERIGKGLVAIASGILSGLGGFAGMQMGASVQQQLNPKPNTTQANQQTTSQGASGVKIVKNADDVVYNGSSIDKSFSKHRQDFGKYPDGSKTSVNAFTNDVKSLINSGTQLKGTYRTTPGTHVYNPATKQWAFINADGTFNTAFKLSDSQYKYLIETGVIK